MPELSIADDPPRAQLLRQVRQRLPELVPELRIVAEGVLGADSSIDFVGIEPTGRAVLVLVGREATDLELVALAAAQRAWVESRLRDWLQLAPELGLRPQAGARVVVLCPDFRPEAVAAAKAIGADWLCLARYRCLQNGSGLDTLLEAVIGRAEPAPGRAREPVPDGFSEAPAEPGPPPFRTGLREADLRLSPEECAELESDTGVSPRGEIPAR